MPDVALPEAPDPARVALEAARSWLAAQRTPEGAWGYLPGQPAHLEATVLAAAAGLPFPASWASAQPPSYGTLLLPSALWSTHPVESAAALEWIEQTAARETEEAQGHDGTIPGWGWVTGTAAWVEPTAYAVLSLRRAGRSEHPRCVDGLRLLRDRQCEDGGWNYGNPVTLGTALEGQIVPTAWALLALPPGDPAAERGMRRLDAVIAEPSTLGLAVAALARSAHGLSSDALVPSIASRLREGHARHRVDLTALAAAALAASTEGRRVFW